ncbi:MAG: complex I NDUFA9 subunit family protein [Anaerolineae bacterium]
MILVTGGTGFVGSHLVPRLIEGGKPVRCLVRSLPRAERLRNLGAELVEGDVTNLESLPEGMTGVDTVIHLVAIAIEKGGATYEAVNYQGTLNVLEAARAARVGRFIYMSQLGADSRLPYRFLSTKGKGQDAVQESNLAYTIFRPSVIFGPEDQFANILAQLILLSPLIFPIVGDGQARFQPIWVEDVVTCLVQTLGDESTVGETYELGGPEVLTYEQMVDRVMETIDARRLKLHVPVPLLRPLVMVMELALPSPPVTTSLLQLLNVDNTIEANAVEDKFGLQPLPFEPGSLQYMRGFTLGGALRRLLSGA